MLACPPKPKNGLAPSIFGWDLNSICDFISYFTIRIPLFSDPVPKIDDLTKIKYQLFHFHLLIPSFTETIHLFECKRILDFNQSGSMEKHVHISEIAKQRNSTFELQKRSIDLGLEYNLLIEKLRLFISWGKKRHESNFLRNVSRENWIWLDNLRPSRRRK